MRPAFGMAAPLAVALAAAPAAPPSIAQAVVAEAHAMAYARGLTALGPRLTGSAAYQRAAEWTAAQLRDAGVTHVGFEPFTIPDAWERDSASARIVAPEPLTLRAAALGWTPSTRGPIEAELVTLNDATVETIAAAPALVAGRVVLLRAREAAGGPLAVWNRRREIDRALARAGAVAILSPDADRDDALVARDRTPGAAIGALPAAQIARGDAEKIRALIDRGPVRIAIELRNRVTAGPVAVNNVVAEIRGRERADEWVIVGAHLDSWDVSPAAQDNATGVAMVLEAARVIARQPRPALRSIRFVLWGGEEQGQLGSNAYAAAHAGDFDRWIAYLNTDAGSGTLIGWTAPGRRDVVEAARRLLHPLLAPAVPVAFDASMQYAFQSDGAAFIHAGVPTLDLNADDGPYEEIHHKSTDTIERVDEHNLVAGAATVASSAYAIADAPTRLAPRRRAG